MKNAHLLPTDELFQVERRIARRADELARRYGCDPAHSLDPWRQAETEFWLERTPRADPAEKTRAAACVCVDAIP